ncbi:hypothetical protein KKH43_01605 [Patescibacteria group bacterium]|nr:hypothetical protein [Patescibacteria group bacterium]
MNPENPPFIPKQEQEKSFDLETWLSSELHEQYEETAKTLNELGLLEILPECGEIGIVGTDGEEYPLPSEEQIKAEILEHKELFETKMKQGFTKIEITPFGLPLERLIDAAKRSILKHHKKGKLFGTRKNPEDESEPLEPLELDENELINVLDNRSNADTAEAFVYYPKEFSENHQGFTKPELLDASEKTPFPGFSVYLREKNTNIPREGQGQTQGGRKQLEAGKSSEEYLKILQTHEEYQNESGQTLEDWLTLFATHLKKTNQVIDDYQGNGTYNRLIGSYHSSSGDVRGAAWDRDDQRIIVSWDFPTSHGSDTSVRPVVRVPPLQN